MVRYQKSQLTSSEMHIELILMLSMLEAFMKDCTTNLIKQAVNSNHFCFCYWYVKKVGTWGEGSQLRPNNCQY